MAVSIHRKKELIKQVKEVMQIKFRYYWMNRAYSAECDPRRRIIGFAKVKKEKWQRDTETEFIGDILHELAHIYCYQKRKFWAYHREPQTRAQKIAHLATAYRAEQYVDRMAKKWAKEFFGLGYSLKYTNRIGDKKWFEDNYKAECRAAWGWK